MTGHPPTTYWLLADGLPTGPFSTEEIQAKVARNEVRADVPACPLGGSVWTPLSHIPGILAAEAQVPPVETGEPSFWLLVGPVPTGPFSAGQIRSKLATGEVT